MNPFETPVSVPSPKEEFAENLPWCYRRVRTLLVASLVPFLVPLSVLAGPLGFGMSVFVLLSLVSIISVLVQLVVVFQVMMKLDGSPSLILNFAFVLLFFCVAKDCFLVYFVLTFELPSPG